MPSDSKFWMFCHKWEKHNNGQPFGFVESAIGNNRCPYNRSGCPSLLSSAESVFVSLCNKKPILICVKNKKKYTQPNLHNYWIFFSLVKYRNLILYCCLSKIQVEIVFNSNIFFLLQIKYIQTNQFNKM